MVERQSQARNECKRGHRGRGFESRYRTNWLEGRGTPPREIAFLFFFYFFSLLSFFLSSFFLFPSSVSEQFSFSGHVVNCQLYLKSCRVFCRSEVDCKDYFSLKQKWFCFSLTVLCVIFTSFLPLTFLMYYPFQASHPSISNESQKEVKCFLSMSTCRTLTLRCRCPIVNCSEVLFFQNKKKKQAGKCLRIRAGAHLRHQPTFP